MLIKVSIPGFWNGGSELSQFLEKDGTIESHRLVIDKKLKRADAWVIVDGCDLDDSVCEVPRERVFFVTAEQIYADDHYLGPKMEDFLAQFSAVYSPYPVEHTVSFPSPPFLPWMVNSNHGSVYTPHRRDLGYLSGYEPRGDKSGVSVICSTKAITPGHRTRLWFVKRLKKHFGDNLTWFGNGVQPLSEKWDGLDPFIATIAIENRISPDIFTEKLFDPLITHTIPLYAGAPNIQDYFPLRKDWLIDVRNLPDAVRKISRLLELGPDDQDLASLQLSRDIVFREQHYLRRIVRIAAQGPVGPPTTVRLKPTPKPQGWWVSKIKRVLRT